MREVRAIPVVAHAERYEFIQDDPEIVYRWRQEGYEIQVNKGSFMGRFGRRAQETAYELLNHNLVSAIASDAHSPLQRTTCMADAYNDLLKDYPRNTWMYCSTQIPREYAMGKRRCSFEKFHFENHTAGRRTHK